MRVSTETITPAIAAQYLKKSTGNRNLRTGAIAQLAADMTHGRFLDNGQTIRFSNTGRLMDGHHRLSACVMADTSFKSIVVRGVAEEAATTIDTGVSRSTADHLKFRGEAQYVKASAAISSALNILSPQIMKLTVDLYDRSLSTLGEAHKFATASLFNTSFFPSPVIGAFIVAHRADPERVEKFAIEVRDGGASRGSSAAVLRDFLMMHTGRHQRGNARLAKQDVARKVLTGIHAHLHELRREKLVTSNEAVRFFVDQYSGTKLSALIKEAAAMRNMAQKVTKAANAPKVEVKEKAAA